MVMTPPPALVEETVPKVLLLRAGLPVMGADYLKVLGVATREEGGRASREGVALRSRNQTDLTAKSSKSAKMGI
jgi:hypothetical protein